MKGRVAQWVAVPVLVVMIGFLVVLATSDVAGNDEDDSPLEGRQAPSITGELLRGDGSFVLADHEGEWVLVNFFATWCTPCVQEHPELVNFAERHEAAGDASVVSVVYDADEDNVRDFFEDNGGDWPVIDDPEGRIALSYGVSGVPESYLIAPNGVVVEKITGGVTASGLDGLLARAKEAYR
ncbi:MAG: TlpA disulfide reductase family protein [Acidimicrobiales bacterium]|nr:TlpA disulfide reductase family protein [Acidimicrobiales bacterium]